MAIPIDISAGRFQEFDYDCEICCRPLVITVEIGEGGEVSAQARRA